VSDRKRPVDQLLDLFVYAPLGFVLNLDEVVPQLIEKGHQQVNMARMFGQFAVQTGTEEVKKRVERMAERGPAPAAHAPSAPEPSSAPTPAPSSAPVAAADATAAAASAPASGPGDAAPAVADLAIPDYDSLAASQVVPRLEGLSSAERDAVRRYETAHRHRKTILSKLAQLG